MRVATVIAALGVQAVAMVACATTGDDPGARGASAPTSESSSVSSEDSARDEQEAVRRSFERYRRALLARDGETAAGLVSERLRTYYVELRDRALHADEAEVRKLRLADKYAVASIRVRFDAADIQGLSGREMIALAVDAGLIGRDGVEGVEVASVRISGPHTATLSADTAEGARVDFQYRLEGGEWRIDFTELLELANDFLERFADEQDLTDDEFIVQTLTSLTGQRVTVEEIYEPMV